MAVKKTKQTEQVEENIVVEDKPVEEEKVIVDTEEKSDEDTITVDTDAFEVNEVNIPEEKEKKVKIRMRVDHHCVIAMERYDLKAGKTYDVPANVKGILDKAGLLSPL